MKRAISYSALILMIIMSSAKSYSQDIRVTVKAQPDTGIIMIGDHLKFTVITEQPTNIRLIIPQISDTLVSGLEVLERAVRDTLEQENERIIITDRYIITSFDTGKYEIPPFYAEFSTGDEVKRFYSDYSYLQVKRAEIDPPDTETGFFDIIAPYRVPLTAGEIMPWIIAVVLAVAAGWFVYQYFSGRRRRRRGNEMISQLAIIEAAHVIAYRNLERLKNDKLWQQERYKEYFTRLTEIVREYIDSRYGLNSMESTTVDTLTQLRKQGTVSDEALDSVKRMLLLADMVKFAKLLPEQTDCELSMEQAWSFVSLTRKERREIIDKNSSEEGLTEEK